ncbi:MFS transporter [Paenibacillus sp. 19GGS1-52]|uniref:MFS transporter n=1 Tax=Paenibacillus sp. 19GGS1-52 TaxID=2758563 RepID=UPI001EFB010A|nr:MFS transporter [Paenibacillus sp. 19GGS1-52]ULO05649.1 MFS transporter [Paenibacillus sp. 19GGS1-52]
MYSKKIFAYSPSESLINRKGYHWLVVFTVCIGAFMAALDASIINLALPTLVRQFGISMSDAEWISLVYLLTLASLVIPFGRLADMFGRRWMYAAGFSVFLFSSLLCGLSSSLTMLLLSRVLQAIGAAMLQANSVSIITASTPLKHRGKAIGIQASAQGIGLSLGPVIGGAFLSIGDWRWLFFVNIPIGIIGTILAVLLLPKDIRGRKREPFDYWGVSFLIPALVMIVYVLNKGEIKGWTSPIIILCLFTGLLALTSFIREERRSNSPLLDLNLFKNNIFLTGNVSSFLSFTAMYGVLLLSPFLIESEFHTTIAMTGFYLSFVPIGMTVFTPVSGFISDRFGIRFPAIMGMSAVFGGCILLAFIQNEQDTPLLLSGLLLVGIGMGIFTPPNNSHIMGSVPKERLGVAGATLNMSRTIGMGMGVTLSGMLYQISLRLLPATSKQSNITAYRISFVLIGLLSAAALFIALFQKRSEHKYSEEFIEYYI